MITGDPTDPDVGESIEMTGARVTVKATPLLATPPTVTTTFPLVAPEGTCTMMLVLLHPVGPTVAPLNVMVLPP